MRTDQLDVVAGANGVAVATWSVHPIAWRYVRAIALTSSSAASCTALVQVMGSVVSGTSTGGGDSATFAPPLGIPPGATLVIRWAGCTPGAQCTAVIQSEP